MTEKLLKIEEVADMLGFSVQGVYSLVFKKKIPAVKISKRALRFDPVEIRKWLEQKKTQAAEAEPKLAVRKSPGRPRKNGSVNSSYVDNIVNAAKREVLDV